ncbi:MAG: hypothetical protein MOB07_19110 [Acidobacteria bacterium]|nr:hypothetical protein [Acidobacteriota bacterium]
MKFYCLLLPLTFGAVASPPDQPTANPNGLTKAIQELQHAHGMWAVTTEFLKPDGAVARTVKGTYRFSWIIPDRVLAGQTDIPELKQTSGILFYLNERRKLIEMASVGGDGNLWVMTGVAGSDIRTTKPFPTADGKTSQLRFTRYNVKPDSFESKMEYTEDGGKTWLPGNHQVFRRSQ